jgi:DNA mismatch endonuclease (patch repair protein)
MTDVFTPQKRSAVMRAVKASGTTPERTVRRLLTGLGLRYRLQRADLPGKPDIVLPGRRLAIRVHGCFWHGHDCARGARVPRGNQDYWRTKIARNRARDQRTLAELRALGWRVETVWECEMKDELQLCARLAAVAGVSAPAPSSPGPPPPALPRAPAAGRRSSPRPPP